MEMELCDLRQRFPRVMMDGAHKAESVFERFNIVSDEDLKEITRRHVLYHREQKEFSTGTILDFNKKERSTNVI